MATNADRNFIVQQGFDPPELTSCGRVTSALLFQPRVVGLVVIAGVISQSPAVFWVLAALLWWGVLFPRLSVFDFTYNHTLGRRHGAPALTPPPVPRRFAQGVGAAFATATAATMAAGQPMAGWVLQAFFLVAVAALAFGRFCFGSFIYQLLRGRVDFAIRTLPWGPGD